MLSILNQYAHGLVAIPVIAACRRAGLFLALRRRKALPFSLLVSELSANDGHFRVALRLLQSIGWVNWISEKDAYVLTSQAQLHKEIPEDIEVLLSFPFDDYLDCTNETDCGLERWITLSERRWNVSDPTLANYLDGVLVVPLLLRLRQREQLKAPLLSGLSGYAKEELIRLFIDKQWCSVEQRALRATPLGREIFERIGITAVVASYDSMLQQMGSVTFGDCKSVFESGELNEEAHVDRTLNVIGSGFQHRKYFADMEDIVLSIFDRVPIEEQPNYVADTGCGDGTLLKHLYEVIRTKSARGKVLGEYPLRFIGIDFNEAALMQARKTLAGVDHLLIKGDIGDPQKVVIDLQHCGVLDVDAILHVRSFLDHDRPYIPPADINAAGSRTYLAADAGGVDQEGREIAARDIVQSLVEHLKRWASVVGRYGLVVLEVHCVEPDVVNRNLGSECLHFDAYHAFSGQLLVRAERHLMAAAEAGLFPNACYFRKYPKTQQFTRITLSCLERRSYTVRTARNEDVPALATLEKRCWATGMCAAEKTILDRVARYPEGQLVLELNGELKGCIYSQRIERVESLEGASIETVAKLHTPKGPIVQLLTLNISPDVQDQQLGDQLLEFTLQRCALLSNVHTVLGVTRCKDYVKHSHLPLSEYIELRTEQGEVFDTILRFHEQHGAKIKCVIPEYRPTDHENRGFGVLIEYDIHYRERRDKSTLAPTLAERLDARQSTYRDHANITQYITKLVGRLLGMTAEDSLDLNRPLMELGLDSADLLEVSTGISNTFNVALTPLFFFEQNTCSKLIAAVTTLTETLNPMKRQAEKDASLTNSRTSENEITRRPRELRPRNSSQSNRDVAIIGIACRLPHTIETLAQLWDCLVEGRSVVGGMPKDRWRWPVGIAPDDKHLGIDQGAFLNDIAAFDCAFFRISPHEAALMDPQQRILLELSWQCLEDAGYSAASLAGSKTGVYVGASGSDYRAVVDRLGIKTEGHSGLGTSMSLLPNRVSYFYDFRGPSLQIDTACSSSLVALHEATQLLNSGSCEQALVAGINIMCDPANTIAYYAAGMLAKDGRCKTFDAAANGYVRGEGAVVLFVKSLECALRDGDHVYAVVKGGAVNHGGQASGLTVPNPQAQAALLVEAYHSAGVDMQTIGYVEAHGTGTSLGDPLEVQGLKLAFWCLATDQHSSDVRCGLGSVKTNLGHLEAAAGFASVLKVILSLQHRTIPASLHFRDLNPQIDFTDTPFYVASTATFWSTKKEEPRRAGVSSFGSGGTNAHVIIEEYAGPEEATRWKATADHPALIVLSAKNDERLQAQVQQLLTHLDSHRYTEADLADIAYTLQVGREALEYRLAFTATTMQELQAKLTDCLAGKAEQGEREECYRGEVKKHKEALSIFTADEDLQKAIAAWLEKGKYSKLLELWAKGLVFDWNQLYTDGKPRRISLPTYPFARERYWVETNALSLVSGGVSRVLHPLLQANTSDLNEQRFSSTFNGTECFLKDHVVQGDKVMPGVAYLEMARAAVERSAREASGARTVVALQNVVWSQPVVVSEATEVHIGLYSNERGEIEFEIYTQVQDARSEAEEVIHAQGRAVMLSAVAEQIDLSALRKRCDRSIEVGKCYAAFAAMGLEYGAAHRGLTSVQVGQDGEGQGFVLAQVQLPACVSDSEDQYVLHPSVLDSALQASIGLWLDSLTSWGEGASTPALPFALERLEVLARSPRVAMVYVRSSAARRVVTSSATVEHAVATGGIQKLDIDVCDESGRVCVRLKGFTSRVVGSESKQDSASKEVAVELAALPEGVSISGELPASDGALPVVLASEAHQIPEHESLEARLYEKTGQYLKRLLASTLKLSPERIEADVGLEKYGIDSILALQLVNELEGAFGSLPKTLLFEYQSIEALAGYFIESHREALISHLKLTERALTALSSRTHGSVVSAAAKTALAVRAGNKRRRSRYAVSALTQQPLDRAHSLDVIDIAIIGISGRYPGANSVEEFWENLKVGKDSITEIPKERWDHSQYFDPEKGKFGKSYSKWGGFIEGVDEFDPLFFNISPREAQVMDPQERLFLQCVYQTLEDAGYTCDALKSYRATGLNGNVGVFVGVMYEEYQLYGAQAQVLGQPYALGGNPSSIANRVSYFCNFHGPSMAVDTMCSSSLTAIHLACQSIKNHGCEVAIAGGVNVSVHPNKYLMLSQGQFASSTGRCESFGEGGDGYVPGEGVGAVLLKPLSKAIEDQDHIYGVIKGTSINHGGKTNGYTVPNPSAQAQVIAQALKESKIDPRTVSYVEAHGTGTSLGDPIEIAGLTQAFAQQAANTEEQEKKQYCAIGSAKSNIGHCESAAGIAGLTKVLLQMQHRTLVPSLHSETLNLHIDFSQTPFRVQQGLSEWQRPIIEIDGVQKEYPRIAGISSFGAGGANAHVIIEEYCGQQQAELSAIYITQERPALIILSAKSEERLKEQAKQLLAHIHSHAYTEADLAHFAYTLQVGREAMEQRLAFTAITISELQEKLTAYVDGKAGRGEIEECYRGEVKKNKEALSIFNTDEAFQQTVTTWIEQGQYTKLLELWAKGLSFDWTKLYSEGSAYAKMKPQRMSLPAYPFAKERHWIEVSRFSSARSGVSSMLHPLLQRNTSDLNEQRFSSVFTGDEFYLHDHVVGGTRVLPGVCYLEMARAAVERSAGVEIGAQPIVLQNVVWLRPVVVSEATEVHIGLTSDNSGAIEFEIYTTARGEESEQEAVIHAQGRAVLMSISSLEGASRMDLAALRTRCDRSIEIAACYAAFSAMGIEYGPAHCGLASVQVGTDVDGQVFVLAQVKLPECVSATQDHYVLHPSVLDSALQASMGCSLIDSNNPLLGHDAAAQPMLPFALERVEIVGRSPEIAWVIVRPSEARTAISSISGSIQKVDIDICDETGRVCVRLKGLTSRVLSGEVGQAHQEVQEEQILLLTPRWEAKPLPIGVVELPMKYSERWVVLASTYKACVSDLKAQCPAVQWAVLPDEASGDGWVAEQRVAAGEQVFACVQSILKAKPKQAVLLQVVSGTDAEQRDDTGSVSGLLKSARLENPKFSGQAISLSRTATVTEIAQAVEENASAAASRDQEIRYVNGVREVAGFKELTHPIAAVRGLPWQDGGVYLITGGAGGLGRIVAQEIASKVQGAKIILTGRSTLSEAKQAQIETLQDQGHDTRIEYRILDVTDANAVTQLVHAVVEHYGALNGIVHSAGVIHDNFIIKKTLEEFTTVVAPKITGTVNLDRATQDIELDFLMLFSSLAGALGNVGQADYAFANAFMDRYAAQRNQLVRENQRHGKTLSINWPLWADGGMHVDAITLQQLQRQGIDVLSTALGIDALYRAWASDDESQVVVLAGDRQKLEQLVGVPAQSVAITIKDVVTSTSDRVKTLTDVSRSELPEKTIQYLKKLLASTLKLTPDRLESDVGFEKYGIDSILALQLVNELEGAFGSLPKTLLFEYQSIEALADYFIEHHREVLISQLKFTEKATTVLPRSIQGLAVSVGSKRRRGRFVLQSQHANPVDANTLSDIAIIGISGRYPGANNVNEYWENLKAGKDSITEIPNERWDYREYFDAEKGKLGKSYSKWGGFIEGVDEFDPLFFNISPREAMGMDPQERLFLQCVYQTVEDAGYTRETLKSYRASGLDGNVGVFVGVMYEEYQLYGAQAQALGQPYALGGNPSSIANRVSYFCNLHGPSMAVDTMCSSSLTAIHLACQSIKHHGCELAIAGGVNVSIHPNKYLALSQGQFASSTGRCESFGEGGDGYVPGEGVGAVLLKPLYKAMADQDHIYGVIKGTSINHGGKTHGYTVPNPSAQAQVIASALQAANIDARTISYIEAHGTGTSLGDPIEIAGLTHAFSRHTHDTQFCAIGSAKSNIGHLESAAGIAGVTKVLLQLKHRALVPSLHSQVLNPHIDFSRTPFKVQQDLSEWQRPILTIDGEQKAYPRIAGISSFGAGGANAHVIIEEYAGPEEATRWKATADHPALIVLSAKNDERLQAQVQQLLTHLDSHRYTEADLADIAYTLQVGREALEYRLAFTATTMQELQAKLTDCLAGKAEQGEREECYRGEVKKHKEALSIFTADEDLQKAIAAWLEKGKYSKLLELWAKGLVFDWNQLYTDGKPRRISLPTYPFARERYWVETNALSLVSGGVSRVLHPLLQANTSDLNEQRFSSTFNGTECFLKDHVVQGDKVMPGVAYLEMARAAVERSAREASGARTVVALQNVVWSQPVVVSEATEVHIGLYSNERGEIEFEIYTQVQDARSEAEEVIHAQGRAVMLSAVAEQIDLSALRKRCDRSIEVGKCYAAFAAMGLEYGAAHRGLTSVQVGQDGEGQGFVLAQVQLPACVSDSEDQYVLHPSVLDSALQASIGLWLDSLTSWGEGASTPALPFALERLEVLARSPRVAMVYVRSSAARRVVTSSATVEHAVATGGIQKLDIDVCDESGRVCVRLKGFTSRVVGSESKQDSASKEVAVELAALPEGVSISGELPASDGALPVVLASEAHQIPEHESLEARLYEKTGQYLKRLLASTLKLSPERIEADVGLEKYGIDSILALQLVNELEGAFGSLPKTLLFEYQSIEALAGYFIESHREALISHLKLTERALTALSSRTHGSVVSAAAKTALAVRAGNKRRRSRYAVSALTQQPLDRAHSLDVIDIAIIGISGRYPGANSVEEFWENLKVGKDSITEIPKERWDHSQYFDPEKGKFGKSYSKWGGFIEGVDEFDPLFFNISPREAQVMDPQVGLYMETVWELLEVAGYTREILRNRYRNRVGLYVGLMYAQYSTMNQESAENPSSGISPYSAIPNHVSHFFGFNGPSIAIDTMCSSSTLSIHLACKDLVQGECELAIAGGVNLSLQPNKYLRLSQAEFLGSSLQSRSFADGDGYLPAEGVGAVLLKNMSKAVADKDEILAIIKATATNHSGHGNGFSVPNPIAQAELIEGVIKKAKIEPHTIGYVEAAANGSSLGDAIEIRALEKVFGATTARGTCAIGSVKSNIGHAEAASGISQLTKVVLQLRHRLLVPTRIPEPINPNLNLGATPFCLQDTLQEWKCPKTERDDESLELPRRALINSFGAGGSYASMVVEEYLAEEMHRDSVEDAFSNQEEIIVLSGQNSGRLQAIVGRLLSHIKQNEAISLRNLAYTLQVCREAMCSRAAWVVSSRAELMCALEDYIGRQPDHFAKNQSVPTYYGERDEHLNLQRMLSGSAGAAMTTTIVSERDLAKIAFLWTHGGEIPWQELHNGRDVRKISLPTYPFRKARLALPTNSISHATMQTFCDPTIPNSDRDHPGQNIDKLQDYIVQFLAIELAVEPSRIRVDRDLREYGVDSLISRRLLRGLKETFGITISGKQLLNKSTVVALLALARSSETNSSDDTSLMGADDKRSASNQRGTLHSTVDCTTNQSLLMECFKEGVISCEEMEALIDQGSFV